MAGLRRLLDDSGVLVDDSSICRVVAGAACFRSTLAVSGFDSGVDGDVGAVLAGDAALGGRVAVSGAVDVGSCGIAVRLRLVYLYAICKEFQRETTGWSSGDSWVAARAATRDGWNPGAGAASGISGASERDAGLERGDRASRVLGSDGFCDGDGRGDDSHGGCGVGEAVWIRVCSVSSERSCSLA